MDKKSNNLDNIETFFSEIKEQNGIADLWLKVLQMLQKLDPSLTLNALKVLCIYFSLLDDGNICISLNADKLLQKWKEKWNGLLMVSKKESALTSDIFKETISAGVSDILNKKDSIISADNPFIIKEINNEKWLFASKYFSAKLSIEERIKILFPKYEKNETFEAEKEQIVKYFEKNTYNPKLNKPITLNEEQAEAIVLGRKNNLIITGGPGTGKTTAVCYLLWELLKTPEYSDYNLYLAAPSGKAADRMKESISDSLSDFKPELISENREIFVKLTLTDSRTIHRLLGYNPSTNGFNHNKENQFEENSIFIIDEASMIDIHLFKCLLEAIPDNARVFILGDKDQLPSVQAGAVLGELIMNKKDSLVSLVKSNRFNEDSQVGRLKNELQKPSELPENMEKFGVWLKSEKDFTFSKYDKKAATENGMEENPVYLYEVQDMDKEKQIPSKAEQIKTIALKWSAAFAKDLAVLAKLPEKKTLDVASVKRLWAASNEAKILCAERDGIRGVEGLNKIISECVCKEHHIKKDDDGYFVGQLLILTSNQKMFRLYNGDCGVVVNFENDTMKYIMIEKKASEEERDTNKELEEGESGIFRFKDFVFYPLYLLPKDSMETAYAITIHKSQGSGYNNIMVLLPEQEGHPLLNRQIVYTAVTRTKGNTYIVASRKTLNYAKKTLIVRDTLIEV